VANFTSSFRAPALEELYNNGPHPGNLAFEIGNEDLVRERSNGLDLSFRHQGSRIRIESNFFYYDIRNFVYLAPTGDIEDDLDVFDYSQGNSRFVGTEQVFDVAVHPNFWLNLGLDSVNAKLKASDTPLPRIPPMRAHIGFDVRHNGLSLRPEVQMANAQNNTFENETSTAGYSVFNLKGSYTIAGQHNIHVFAVNAFNLGDRLYRNHVSFVKDVAPEIGRGVSFTYTLKFF
jgi:iron complex outermembrane receptor protein